MKPALETALRFADRDHPACFPLWFQGVSATLFLQIAMRLPMKFRIDEFEQRVSRIVAPMGGCPGRAITQASLLGNLRVCSDESIQLFTTSSSKER